MLSEQERLRIRVVQFYINNKSNRLLTVKHFLEENVSRSTLYHIISRFEATKSTKRSKGSGRKPKIMTKKVVEKLRNLIKSRKGFSQNAAAKKFSCSQSYINKVVATKCNLRCFKKVKSPKYSQKSERIVKKTARKLYDFSKNKVFILDDEKYFTLSDTHMPGNSFYYIEKKQKENKLNF